MSRSDLPAEQVVPLDGKRARITMYVTFSVFDIQDLDALRGIKKVVRNAEGSIVSIPTPRKPAVGGGWHHPTVTSSEESE